MRHGTRAGRLVAVLLMLATAAGCGLGAAGDRGDAAAPPPVTWAAPEPTRSAELDDLTMEEGPEPDPSPSRKPPSDRKPDRKPRPSRPATGDHNGQAPDCPPKRRGKAVSRVRAKAALTAAAAKTYWPVSAPEIKVPVTLVKAVAWQESGWQSNLYACDGGVGLMQVMPDTAAHMNQRFEKSYDIDRYTDNAILGANYLAWLTKYFGERYFDEKYALSAKDCAGDSDLCLLNLVIAAYNFGHGAVDAGIKRKRLPNPEYVESVRSLMRSCRCLRF